MSAKEELTQQELEDIEFFKKVHHSTMHKVGGGIWKPIREGMEEQVVAALSVDDRNRYYRGQAFDLLGSYSINGVPQTADDIRRQNCKKSIDIR